MRKRSCLLLLTISMLAVGTAAHGAEKAKWSLWNDPQGDIVTSDNTQTRKEPSAKVPAPPPAPAAAAAPRPATRPDAADPKQAPGAETKGVVDADYVIGAGDVIDISVWKDEALAKTVVVLPDGKIAFPLIGEVEAAGKKVTELKQEMESRLSKYVTDLVLSVDVKQANSMIVYVLGRVNAPGRFPLMNGNVNVLQALAMAGGFNPYASKDKVKIYRESNGRTEVLSFRYTEITSGKNPEQNVRLNRGDVIVVP
ncbi:MAG: polysaccharide biosynthesis/export family protein [Candidatus Deferrimicrobium sp.]